jgi:hypothetical protein
MRKKEENDGMSPARAYTEK